MESKERIAYKKKWKKDNPKKVAANHLRWNKENPEKQYAIHKKWREENPEKFAVYAKASQAKAVENLTDGYVSTLLSRRKDIHQTARQLREYPEIIECFRAVLKLRRMCRIKNRENGK